MPGNLPPGGFKTQRKPIRSELNDLEPMNVRGIFHDGRKRHPSQVELSVRVELIDVRAKRVLASRVFDVIVPALAENASGGVGAANAALQRVLELVADFCVAESAR
jgi:hypothetical protein